MRLACLKLRRLLKTILRFFLIVVGVELVVVILLILAVHFYGQADHAENADVIIVLGAGLRYDGEAGAALTRRTRYAADLWRQGYAPNLICTGGVAIGRVRSEADACREVLLEEGVPDEVIILEERSRSTEENAIFTHPIMTERGWTSAVLVTDGFHLLRAQWIFSLEGITVYPSPTVNPAIPTYVFAVLREVAALHWQLVQEVLNLPYTYVPAI